MWFIVIFFQIINCLHNDDTKIYYLDQYIFLLFASYYNYGPNIVFTIILHPYYMRFHWNKNSLLVHNKCLILINLKDQLPNEIMPSEILDWLKHFNPTENLCFLLYLNKFIQWCKCFFIDNHLIYLWANQWIFDFKQLHDSLIQKVFLQDNYLMELSNLLVW